MNSSFSIFRQILLPSLVFKVLEHHFHLHSMSVVLLFSKMVVEQYNNFSNRKNQPRMPNEQVFQQNRQKNQQKQRNELHAQACQRMSQKLLRRLNWEHHGKVWQNRRRTEKISQVNEMIYQRFTAFVPLNSWLLIRAKFVSYANT